MSGESVSEYQARTIVEEGRRARRRELRERAKWGWSIAQLLAEIERHPDWTVEMSGDHRPTPPRPLLDPLDELLAKWDAPDRPEGWNLGSEHHLAASIIHAMRTRLAEYEELMDTMR